ncbi:Major Facilitator Superfamily protein [Paenibacillus konkukensis]|uniref:Major Facilitator Superfamily protein n=1 Tax=Paenibacillus konkukensis TaxID=2020716 RepID=A0ABY4RLW1_9BACL|nr:MFS transporter [Paenibacillus konkukensis]UQZ83476.1 Major Facilitator Superfamily protein [Paenibacillus konkukensis]
MKRIQTWLGTHRTARLLQTAAILRSMCQGIGVVALTLYLKELGWSGGAVGELLVAAGLFRAVMAAFAGELNALLGPKRYMLLWETVLAVSLLAITWTANPAALCCAAVASGFGRGHAGSGGPSAAVERKWLIACSGKAYSRALGVHAFAGYIGMGAGALLAALTPLWQHALPGAMQFRPLFAAAFALAAGCTLVIAAVAGGERKAAAPAGARTPKRMGAPGADGTGAAPAKPLSGFVHLLNGMAAVMATTLTSYWLSAKFGAAPEMISLVLAASYGGAAASALLNIRLAERVGTHRTVVCMQLGGIVFALLLPWSPSFGLAALLVAGCTTCNLGTRASRTDAAVQTRTERGQTSAQLWLYRAKSLLLRFGILLWPGAFGHMIDRGHWALPFYIAAAVQLATTCWYIRSHDLRSPPRRSEPAAAAPTEGADRADAAGEPPAETMPGAGNVPLKSGT